MIRRRAPRQPVTSLTVARVLGVLLRRLLSHLSHLFARLRSRARVWAGRLVVEAVLAVVPVLGLMSLAAAAFLEALVAFSERIPR